MKLVEDLLNIIAPHECLRCRREGSLLCDECADRLQRIPARCYRCKRWEDAFRTCARCRSDSALYQAWSVATYDDATVKELVRALKFDGARGAASAIADRIAPLINITGGAYITHAPTANIRVRERSYDQAQLIARELSRRTGLPYLPLLARTGDQRQLGRQRDTRKTQMSDAFRVLKPKILKDNHIVLVDDVLTTGATCEAAARTLRQAGAKRVSAAVFAVA